MKTRRRPTQATIVAYLALFVALSGTAWAAAQIDSRDIKRNAVLSKHIKKANVKSADLAPGIPRGIEYVDDVSGNFSDDKDHQVECPEGKLPIGGGAAVPFFGATGFVALTVNRPALITDEATSDSFNGWFARAIEVNGGSTQSWGLGVYAICAKF